MIITGEQQISMKFMNVYIYNYCRTSRVLDVDELVSARTCLQKKGVDNCSQKNEGVDGTTERSEGNHAMLLPTVLAIMTLMLGLPVSWQCSGPVTTFSVNLVHLFTPQH